MTIPNEDIYKRNLRSATVLYIASCFVAFVVVTINTIV